ncbi:transcriptional regulator [Pseudomonas sp. NPDC088414]|uniref:transcriptional regulator n=1 Tax=Pseudomonas sp. NPDC088414 TaxID=3364454 RepID=UPI003807326D
MDIFEVLRQQVHSQSALARALGISPQALDGWRRRKQIPAERVLDIERITEFRVTRYMLRPDIFGAAPESIQMKAHGCDGHRKVSV